MSDLDVQQGLLAKDNQKLKDYYGSLYKNYKEPMTKAYAKQISSTPEEKKSLKVKALSGAGIGAVLGAASLLAKKPAKALIPASALIGAGAGIAKEKYDVNKKAKGTLQSDILKEIKSESQKNIAIRSILAKPGKQVVVSDRPWGKERYEG